MTSASLAIIGEWVKAATTNQSKPHAENGLQKAVKSGDLTEKTEKKTACSSGEDFLTKQGRERIGNSSAPELSPTCLPLSVGMLRVRVRVVASSTMNDI
jgi:hypothetical protein